MREFKNYIGGKEINLSGKSFTVKCSFSDYTYELADSNVMDISIALSKVKKGVEEASKLTWQQRKDILSKASELLKFDDEDYKHGVLMTGMPYDANQHHMDAANLAMNIIPQMIEQRNGTVFDQVGKKIGENKYELREPYDGFVYCVSPGNEPKSTAIIGSYMVSLGYAGIIKVAKEDYPTAFKIIKSMVEAGYPENALNILTFDTSKPEAKALNFKMVDEAEVVWVFGDDNTVDRVLRIENRKVLDLEKLYKGDFRSLSKEDVLKKLQDANFDDFVHDMEINHFANKHVIRQGAGRSAGIIDESADMEKSAQLIFDSSTEYPIGCTSIKSLYAIGEAYDKILLLLKQKFEALQEFVLDPMDSRSKVGYFSSSDLDIIEKRKDELIRSGLLNIIVGGERKNQFQISPMLATTNDHLIDFMTMESPIYVLIVKKCDGFQQVVDELNEAAGEHRKMSLGIYSTDQQHIAHYKHVFHEKINTLTPKIDIVVHNGYDYVHDLTISKILDFGGDEDGH